MRIAVIIALLLLASILTYTLWHIWSVLPLSNLWRAIITILFAAMVLSIFFVVFPIIDRLPLNVGTVIYEIGGSGLMIMFYTLLSFLILDIARLVHIIPRSVVFDNGYTAVILTLLLFGVFLYGNIHYHHKVRREFTLTTTKPLERDLKIILMSDLHIGYHNRSADLEKWVEMLNSENADFILMAGDLVDRSLRPLLEEHMEEALQKLNAPVYACIGNHEYFTDIAGARQFYRDAGIHLLTDSVAVVDGVNIIGRDDRTNARRKSIKEILEGRNMETSGNRDGDTDADGNTDGNEVRYTIVVDHQPFHLEEAEEAGVDFQLSGHTHDGQIFPMSLILRRVYENSYGHSHRNNTQYYVTSGLGIWGGKFRIGTCSEYVVVTLKSTE